MTEQEQRQYDQMQRDLQAMAARLEAAETKLEQYEISDAELEPNLEILKRFEGLELKAYMDGGGFLHIGHGTRIGPSIAGAKMPDGRLVKDLLDAEESTWISPRAAEWLAREDLRASLNRLKFDLGSSWWLEFEGTPRGQAVLDAYYTMGSLTEFPSCKKALRERRWHDAALELLYVDPNAAVRVPSAYNQQTGGRAVKVAHAIAEDVWI